MNKNDVVEKVLVVLQTTNKQVKKKAEKLYDKLHKIHTEEEDLIYQIAEQI